MSFTVNCDPTCPSQSESRMAPAASTPYARHSPVIVQECASLFLLFVFRCAALLPSSAVFRVDPAFDLLQAKKAFDHSPAPTSNTSESASQPPRAGTKAISAALAALRPPPSCFGDPREMLVTPVQYRKSDSYSEQRAVKPSTRGSWPKFIRTEALWNCT